MVIEEEHVRLHAMGIEDTSWQAQDSVQVSSLEKVLTHGLPGSALEQDVVGDNDGGAASSLKHRANVLHEIELFV